MAYKFLRVFGLIKVVTKQDGAARGEGFEGDLVNYQHMRKDEAREILNELNKRGVKYHYIFTGGLIDSFNHCAKFYGMFDQVSFKGLETVTHIPHVEHIQVFQEDRAEIIDVIDSWVRGNFCQQKHNPQG